MAQAKEEEALMEAQAILDRFVESVDGILRLLDQNAEADHKNDYTRNEVKQFLLDALAANTAGSKELTDRNLHAALQKLTQQEREDIKDDEPRNKARELLLRTQNKAIKAQYEIRELTGRA